MGSVKKHEASQAWNNEPVRRTSEERRVEGGTRGEDNMANISSQLVPGGP